MRTNAVICEYNPFHNGHRYQLERIKEKSENPITAIMSGNFTQRGDTAIINKFKRAETAVKNGVDLVVELPSVYAMSSAKNFAEAGVKIADALGCCEHLCFSVEESNQKLLYEISDAFESESFNEEIKLNMKAGMYYPQAVEKSLFSISPALSEAVQKPNNILAVEYLNALKHTDIKPLIIKREFTRHDTNEVTKNMASASNIRKMILSGEDYSDYIPKNKPDFSNPADINKLEKIIIYKLRTMSAEEIKQIPDVSEGLENRIFSAAREYNSLEEILMNIKTKRYTLARIRRIMLSSLLGITKDELKREVAYIRVLAFNENGAKIMSEIKKRGKLPLIVNVADGYKALTESAKRTFDIDLLSSDIYSLATDKTESSGLDFTRAVSVIKE